MLLEAGGQERDGYQRQISTIAFAITMCKQKGLNVCLKRTLGIRTEGIIKGTNEKDWSWSMDFSFQVRN